MRKNKILPIILSFGLAFSAFSACSKGETLYKLAYTDNLGVGAEYNRNLYYQNEAIASVGDPSAIYISDEDSPYYGTYIMYGTDGAVSAVSNGNVSQHGFSAYQSDDLVHWKNLGVAFYPELESWGLDKLWAPQVIYDEEDGNYYLFYTAKDRFNVLGAEDYVDAFGPQGHCNAIGVAVSDSPIGPFVEYVSESKTIADPFISAYDLTEMWKEHPDYDGYTFHSIDVSPFEDPATGNKYLYFNREKTGARNYSNICGVQIGTDNTAKWTDAPNWSTFTIMTECGYLDVEKTQESDHTEANTNEGPFMVYRNGKYHLTFSVNNNKALYSVVQTYGADSPLGPFEKVSYADGGKMLFCETAWKNIYSSGHAGFVEAGNQLFIIYHAYSWADGNRTALVDEVKWTKNANGDEIMYVNGPTDSLQPLVHTATEYVNIAQEATVSATNLQANNSADVLNDGLITVHKDYDFVKESNFQKGKSTITLSFNEYKEICSIMIYNSIDYNKYFSKIESIRLYTQDENGQEKIRIMQDVRFDVDRYVKIVDINEDEMNSMEPGGAAIAEFYTQKINKIEITFNTDKEIAVSEIYVLGRKGA